MTVAIRTAEVSDAEDICLLLRSVQDLHASFYPAIFRNADASSLSGVVTQLMSNRAFHVRIAALEGDVAGYAVFKTDGVERSELVHAHRYLFLEQIAVSPPFRRKGIAAGFQILRSQVGNPRITA